MWKRQWMGLEAIDEAEAVAMGEWMQEIVDWICG